MRTSTRLGRIGAVLLAVVRIGLLLATVAASLRCADLSLAGILRRGTPRHLAVFRGNAAQGVKETRATVDSAPADSTASLTEFRLPD